VLAAAFLSMNERVVLRFSVQSARMNKRSRVCSLAAPQVPHPSRLGWYLTKGRGCANLAHQQMRSVDPYTRTTVPVHIQEQSYEA